MLRSLMQPDVVITRVEQLDALVGWLNVKGIREKALHKQLETHYTKLRYRVFRSLVTQLYRILLAGYRNIRVSSEGWSSTSQHCHAQENKGACPKTGC